jgi:hypothetical protein
VNTFPSSPSLSHHSGNAGEFDGGETVSGLRNSSSCNFRGSRNRNEHRLPAVSNCGREIRPLSDPRLNWTGAMKPTRARQPFRRRQWRRSRPRFRRSLGSRKIEFPAALRTAAQSCSSRVRNGSARRHHDCSRDKRLLRSDHLGLSSHDHGHDARPPGALGPPGEPIDIAARCVVFSLSDSVRLLTALRRGLKESGFVEGQNVAIEYRFADSRGDRLPELATELIQRPVAVIVGSVLAAFAAKAASPTLPIVVVTGGALSTTASVSGAAGSSVKI